MNALFSLFDRFPVVRALQIAAVLLFVFGFMFSFLAKGMWQAPLPSVLFLVTLNLVRATYEPLILLGLAEIIKHVSKKE